MFFTVAGAKAAFAIHRLRCIGAVLIDVYLTYMNVFTTERCIRQAGAGRPAVVPVIIGIVKSRRDVLESQMRHRGVDTRMGYAPATEKVGNPRLAALTGNC